MSAAPRTPSQDSYPRRAARTGRFTFGAPRGFTPSPDGERIAFVRSASGTERATSLWVLDVASGAERLVADPVDLLLGSAEDLSPQERSRRERMRESGAGITSFTADASVRLACYALSSRLFVSDLTGAVGGRHIVTSAAVIDPRLSPDGQHVAYAADGGLHVTGARTDGAPSRPLATPEGPCVTYGLADFAAAEELERHRGHWWSPDSDALLVARVDESEVEVWHIGDPENPSTPAAVHRYPAAGTPNADVTLWLLGLDGVRREVAWDRAAYPYLVSVSWVAGHPPLVQVLSRRQERAQVLTVDPGTGATTVLRELADPDWVDVVPGTPSWAPSGELVTVEVVEDRYALCLDSTPVSPAGVQVRAVLDATADAMLVLGSDGPDQHVYRLAGRHWQRLSEPGSVNVARAAGDLVVLTTATPAAVGSRTCVRVQAQDVGGWVEVATVANLVDDAGFIPAVRVPSGLQTPIPTTVLMPTGWTPGSSPLPVLMDPYGGPHHRLVQSSARGLLESQWWADQGFCVIVADGRGTPGTPRWERAVRYDLTNPALEDQVAALHAVAQAWPGALDLDRVGIRGWSFGGYLAALAVLRRPDVFHAAVAGAPVTDWRLYDTAYTERYLGLPSEHPHAYDAGSLVAMAPSLTRPLMIIHGLADDNVVAAHSLRLSSALLAAGRPHTFLPLSGVTHMTPQEVVAENLLRLQLDFLRSALGA
jgi:dipeptidyl-peptidase-4